MSRPTKQSVRQAQWYVETRRGLPIRDSGRGVHTWSGPRAARPREPEPAGLRTRDQPGRSAFPAHMGPVAVAPPVPLTAARQFRVRTGFPDPTALGSTGSDRTIPASGEPVLSACRPSCGACDLEWSTFLDASGKVDGPRRKMPRERAPDGLPVREGATRSPESRGGRSVRTVAAPSTFPPR